MTRRAHAVRRADERTEQAMKVSFTIDADGQLVDPGGEVLGRLVELVVDRPPSKETFKEVKALNVKDNSNVNSNGNGKDKKTSKEGAQASLLSENAGEPASAVAPEVSEVWAHYKAVTHSRRQLKARDVRLIQAALKLRGLTVVKRAISGLAASPFHNGENAQGKKYLAIRYAIGGNAQTGETAEERIDSMAGLSPDAVADTRFRSRIGANEGRFTALKTTVIQAWRPPDRPPATDAAIQARDDAIVELREFGIAVSFREPDGWPIFDELSDHEAIG
jgi:hypothetical protein